MARFYGAIGYSDGAVEDPEDSGVWVDVVTEKNYQGDVLRNVKMAVDSTNLNPDITFSSNSISIVADQFAIEHYSMFKYVRWLGVLWTVDSVEVRSPRLILNLGSVYNGPVPEPEEPEEP